MPTYWVRHHYFLLIQVTHPWYLLSGLSGEIPIISPLRKTEAAFKLEIVQFLSGTPPASSLRATPSVLGIISILIDRRRIPSSKFVNLITPPLLLLEVIQLLSSTLLGRTELCFIKEVVNLRPQISLKISPQFSFSFLSWRGGVAVLL